MVTTEHTALLDKNRNPPALVGDPPGPVPPANSKFGLNTFLQDISDPQNGTVPITVLIATVIGMACGVSCFLYYKVLKFGFWLFWDAMPKAIYVNSEVNERLYWTWIPLVVMSLSVAVGVSIYVMGDPGDLKYTVKRVHETGFMPIDHAPGMVVASIASIVGAGSLGPEAPLVAICACLGGWISRSVFKQQYKNLVRRHTLCGMACATAAFFGVPLGGALFALEVNNRLGYEYFEHALAAIYSGTVCLVVFRKLAGLDIGPVWKLTESARAASGGKSVAHALSFAHSSSSNHGLEAAYHNATEVVTSDAKHQGKLVAEIVASSSKDVLIGAVLGLLGAFLAYCFVLGHKSLMKYLDSRTIFRNPIPRAIFGGAGICLIGLIVPHTLFWGEFELETITVKADSAKDLPHLWPHGGTGIFDITGPSTATLVGIAKLAAISITVASGYRGGFIFPFFCAGAGFGRALTYKFDIHPVIAVLSVGAGINVTITRTALATPLILSALAGEPNAAPPILAASLAAIFATAYLPFLSSQRGRENIFEAQLHSYTFDDIITDIETNEFDEEMDRLELR